MQANRAHGVSIIELMIVISLFAVIAGFAVPGFITLLRDNQVTNRNTQLVRSLAYARSEAIKRNRQMSICALTEGLDSCCATATENCNGWQFGWMVFDDIDGNGQLDPDAETLIQLNTTTAPATNLVSGDNSRTVVRFLGNGFIDAANSVAWMRIRPNGCRENEMRMRQIQILTSGRVYQELLECPAS